VVNAHHSLLGFGGTRCTKRHVAKIGKPAMPGSMLWPLFVHAARFMLFYGAVLCIGAREVLNRELQSTWVREAVNQ